MTNDKIKAIINLASLVTTIVLVVVLSLAVEEMSPWWGAVVGVSCNLIGSLYIYPIFKK